MYCFEKWTNHSIHYPSSRNKIPYPPRTFRTWKQQKTLKAIIILPTNEQWNWRMIKKCPNCLTFWNRQHSEQVEGVMWQLKIQSFASSYILLAYIFEASYSTLVTSWVKYILLSNQNLRNRCYQIVSRNIWVINQPIQNQTLDKNICRSFSLIRTLLFTVDRFTILNSLSLKRWKIYNLQLL